MTTIKSFTSLEQSEKLAEFLSLESADMEYLCLKETNATIGSVPFVKDDYEVENSAYDAIYKRIPCWSLAALSEFILPSVVDDDGNNYKFYLSKDGLDRWIAYYKSCDVSIHICEESDNMIDVIFEMICWLKEEKYILL